MERRLLYVSYQHGCAHLALYKKIIVEYNIALNETGIILQAGKNLSTIIEQDKAITASITEWAEKLNMKTISFDPMLDLSLLETIDTALAHSEPMLRF